MALVDTLWPSLWKALRFLLQLSYKFLLLETYPIACPNLMIHGPAAQSWLTLYPLHPTPDNLNYSETPTLASNLPTDTKKKVTEDAQFVSVFDYQLSLP